MLLLGIAGTLPRGRCSTGHALFAAFILTVSGYSCTAFRARGGHSARSSSGAILYWMSAAVPAVSEMSLSDFSAGICAGCAMQTRQFHVPPLFVLFEILNQLFISRGFFFPRIPLPCTGVMVPVLVIQTFFHCSKKWVPVLDIFQTAFMNVPTSLQTDWRLLGIVYIKTIVQCEGVFVPLLAVAGTVLLTRESCSALRFSQRYMLLIMVRRPREEMVREGTTAPTSSLCRDYFRFIYASPFLPHSPCRAA